MVFLRIIQPLRSIFFHCRLIAEYCQTCPIDPTTFGIEKPSPFIKVTDERNDVVPKQFGIMIRTFRVGVHNRDFWEENSTRYLPYTSA